MRRASEGAERASVAHPGRDVPCDWIPDARERRDACPSHASLAASAEAPPAYGVLSRAQKDLLYWVGRGSFLYATPWAVTRKTVRHQAMLLISANREPFELSVGPWQGRFTAAAVAPLTPRGLDARDVGLISLHIGIRHPAFPDFRRVPRPGILPLDRDAFRAFDAGLSRAHGGALDRIEAQRLFEGLVSTTVRQLPPRRGAKDPRHERARALVLDEPAIRLSEIAMRLEVSKTTASRIVADAVGLPLRAYQFGRKCERVAARLMNDAPLTQLAHESGFTDSAHLTHAWQRSFGHPPSYTRDPRHVRVIA